MLHLTRALRAFRICLEDYRHLSIFLNCLPLPSEPYLMSSQWESKIPQDTKNYLARVHGMKLYDVVKYYSTFIDFPQAGHEDPTSMYKMRLRRHATALDLLLKNVLLECGWMSVQHASAMSGDILVERRQTLLEFARSNHHNPWIRISYNDKWICDAAWHDRALRPPPPLDFTPVFHDGVKLEAIPRELGVLLEDTDTELPLRSIVSQLQAPALTELRTFGYRSLGEFLRAHPEAYEVTADGKTVRSVRSLVDVTPYMSEKSLSSVLDYVPAFWVPLFVLEKALKETNNLDIQRAYKTEGKINGLLHPLSGVEVKEFCSVVRESGLILVRRLHRDISRRPCVAAYDEYRTPKALVRALEAALSPTEYTAMEELSASSAAGSMNKWPLDVLLSFYPTTFHMKRDATGVKVRSRRNDSRDGVDTFLKPLPKLRRVRSLIKESAQSQSATARRREARRIMAERGGQRYSDETTLEFVLSRIPEDEFITVRELAEDIRAANMVLNNEVIVQHTTYSKFLNKFPDLFKLEGVPGDERSLMVRRRHSSETNNNDQEANPYYEESKLIETSKEAIETFVVRMGRDMMVNELSGTLPRLARKAIGSPHFGGARTFVLDRLSDFDVLPGVKANYDIVRVKRGS